MPIAKPKTTACLWFDNQAEEAAKFYVSVFKNAKLGRIAHYGNAGTDIHGRPPGSVMTAEFEIDGQSFLALNAGPHFKFTEAVSFIIHCEDQQEVDYHWAKLTADGGEEGPCGWCKDKFGLSWQVTPARMADIMNDPDVRKRDRVMAAFMQMKKLDLATIERAYAG